jgi:cytochrome c-type biogenesis protein CcmE
MKPRARRMLVITGIAAAAAVATALVLQALRSNLVFFYSPSQVAAHEAPSGRSFRVGGLVKSGTLQRDGMLVRFDVIDGTHALAVHYRGFLPDLFKEGKGVVALGQLGSDGIFIAREVLAKHDENYRPPEIAR